MTTRDQRVAAYRAAIRGGSTPNLPPELAPAVLSGLHPAEVAAWRRRYGLPEEPDE